MKFSTLSTFKSILLFLFFYCSFRCEAQIDLLFFTKPDTSRIKGVTYTLSYTSRLTIVDGEVLPFRGVHAGIKFGKNRHRLTLAYFWSNLDPSIQLLNFGKEDSGLLDLSSFTKKDLHYYNLMYYPYWLNTKRWKLSTPLELGIGTITSPKASIFKEIAPIRQDQYFVPVQMGGYIEYKALRHFGLNAEFGYRLLLMEKNMPFNLNGIYFGLGLNVYPGLMWRDYKRFIKRKTE